MGDTPHPKGSPERSFLGYSSLPFVLMIYAEKEHVLLAHTSLGYGRKVLSQARPPRGLSGQREPAVADNPSSIPETNIEEKNKFQTLSSDVPVSAGLSACTCVCTRTHTLIMNVSSGGWGDGSVVQSMHCACACRGPHCCSQSWAAHNCL